MKQRASAEAGSLRKIFEKFGIREGARVLDLASGIGRMSINLAKAKFDVAAVDIPPILSGIRTAMGQDRAGRR